MSLPLTKSQVTNGAAWMLSNFGVDIAGTVAGRPYTAAIVCAIACKETGFIWISRTADHAPQALLPLLVGDASGDVEGHPRMAFPRNTAAFRTRFGNAFTAELISEANAARGLRGLPPAEIVYKGYGVFQYDLQHVTTDRQFFEGRLWHGMGACLDRLARELDRCFKEASGTRDAVRRYNGSGAAAEEYADHVMAFANWCAGLP